jgi:hypothetical protein
MWRMLILIVFVLLAVFVGLALSSIQKLLIDIRHELRAIERHLR